MDEQQDAGYLRGKLAQAEQEIRYWRGRAELAEALWRSAHDAVTGGAPIQAAPLVVAVPLVPAKIPEAAGSPARDCAAMRLEFPEAKVCALPLWHAGTHKTATGEEFIPSGARADTPLQDRRPKEDVT